MIVGNRSLALINGFTIIEMMVVITIMVLLTVAAIPAFQSFTLNNQSASIASRLADTFRLARAEALNSGINSIICPMNPGSSLQSNVCTSTTNWNAWLVFSDKNSNGNDDSGNVIRYYEDIPINTITSDSNRHVIYDSSGFCISGGHMFFIQPKGCSGRNARTVQVMPTGSIHVDFADCK